MSLIMVSLLAESYLSRSGQPRIHRLADTPTLGVGGSVTAHLRDDGRVAVKTTSAHNCLEGYRAMAAGGLHACLRAPTPTWAAPAQGKARFQPIKPT